MKSKLSAALAAAGCAALALNIGAANASPFEPFGPFDVTGTFGTTGQTVSGTLDFLGGLVSAANISISGVPGVFDVILGQDASEPPSIFDVPQDWIG
jgi:hypothetical protein